MFIIRRIRAEDRVEWLRLRAALWPDHTPAELEAECAAMCAHPEREPVFVAERTAGGLCGVIELSIRGTAEGCSTSNVGYIEGWFVDPDLRGHGIGGALVRAGEAWAASAGCSEMASDTTSSYPVSPAAHKALGYEEVKAGYHFRKRLGAALKMK
ncbi:MAG: hypothetical protein AMXMBFR7_36720 [Planctomycetota bacterium]